IPHWPESRARSRESRHEPSLQATTETSNLTARQIAYKSSRIIYYENAIATAQSLWGFSILIRVHPRARADAGGWNLLVRRLPPGPSEGEGDGKADFSGVSLRGLNRRTCF